MAIHCHPSWLIPLLHRWVIYSSHLFTQSTFSKYLGYQALWQGLEITKGINHVLSLYSQHSMEGETVHKGIISPQHMVKILQAHRGECWRSFQVNSVLKGEQACSRLKSGESFPGWGTKSVKVLPENRENTQNGLTESNSTKGLGTEAWARLKETNKEWWGTQGVDIWKVINTPRSEGTQERVRERRRDGGREGIMLLVPRRSWGRGEGPWKNSATSTTDRERTRGITTPSSSLLQLLNLLLLPPVCQTQLKAKGQESPSGAVHRNQPSKALS